MKRTDIPSLDDLRAFETTARLGSVRLAADSLALTHGAVSRRITKLSGDLGFQLFEKSGTSLEQVDHVVCHQANSRIIDHVVKKLGAPEDKFYKNMHRYGNTSAASIPLALDEMLESGAIQPGQTVACVGFGAGLTWGAVLLRF